MVGIRAAACERDRRGLTGLPMRLIIAGVGQKMPQWVDQGFQIFQRRMPGHLPVDLIEVPLPRRSANCDIQRLRSQEGKALIDALPQACRVIALDQRGKSRSTRQLADDLQAWQMDGRHVAFLIGGPDGLSEACLERSEQRWSLSELTLPHPLVRLVLAEQLYRAWSISVNHPYHRE